MPRDRDVQAFHDRAPTYESGWRGKMHAEIVARTAEVALALEGRPRRVLDVGSGTGTLLRLLGTRLGDECEQLAGIDAAPGMIDVARSLADDDRLAFSVGVAEDIAYPSARFDLVVTTTSFDHWHDQGAGLAECARVLAPGGHLVLTDLFSLLLVPTLAFGHRGHARTRRRATTLLRRSGFRSVSWERAYQLIIATAVAGR
jgi:ubiquinone/menaquinone biosynthesis C-methylase UbiE